MTVIAYRDGILAADSEVSQGALRVGTFPKIIRTKKGHLVAGAGDISALKKFQTWAKAGFRKDRRPERIDDLEAVVIRPDGTVLQYEEDLAAYVLEAPFFALGCGTWVAVGAMAAGADAETACKIACQYVHGCKEPVVTLKLITSN